MQVLTGRRIVKGTWPDDTQIEEYEPGGWRNHPAVRMWRDYEHVLLRYQLAVCAEWISRGYKDTCWDKTITVLLGHGQDREALPSLFDPPAWLGDEALHRSHQSNLVRKFPEHYAPQFPGVGPELEYVWPV